MTVFSLPGSKIQTDHDGQITSIAETVLEATTRIGTNTIEAAYLGDAASPFSVSLSDYNLVFDKVHINDTDLPDQIEYFDLVNSDGFGVRILSFVYHTDTGMEERMYSVGATPLQQFRSPLDASIFFAQHEQRQVTNPDDWTIHLDQIGGVKKSGVFISNQHLDAEFSLEDEQFEFVALDKWTDLDAWDVENIDPPTLPDAIAARLGVDAETNTDPIEEFWSDIDGKTEHFEQARHYDEG